MAVDIGPSDVLSQGETLEEINRVHGYRPSVQYIRTNLRKSESFVFSLVNESEICQKLKKLDITKAAGYDNIPPKLIKLGAEGLDGSVTSLINMCIKIGTFPDILKCAEVMLAYKKGDAQDEKNYRPISMLPALSKGFGGVITDQLRPFIESVYSPYLSGFRKNHP